MKGKCSECGHVGEMACLIDKKYYLCLDCDKQIGLRTSNLHRRAINKMKLKTLKDIKFDEGSGCYECGYSPYYLKKAAIEWVKHYMKGQDVFSDYKGRIVFIKDFFNLTEEDLK